jgi:hypothetical protein
MLLLLSGLISLNAQAYNFTACKSYKLNGWIQCADKISFGDCQIVIWKGTRSEIKAPLYQKVDVNTVSLSKFDSQDVSVTVNVRDPVAPSFELVGNPSRAHSVANNKAIQCLSGR